MNSKLLRVRVLAMGLLVVIVVLLFVLAISFVHTHISVARDLRRHRISRALEIVKDYQSLHGRFDGDVSSLLPIAKAQLWEENIQEGRLAVIVTSDTMTVAVCDDPDALAEWAGENPLVPDDRELGKIYEDRRGHSYITYVYIQRLSVNNHTEDRGSVRDPQPR